MTLSVIVPVYNEAATIREVIRQVEAVGIAQEIIVVDDGSADGTPEMLRQLQREHGNALPGVSGPAIPALAGSAELQRTGGRDVASHEASSRMPGAVPVGLHSPCELRVVWHVRNRGKGAAVRSGFQAARGEIVVIQDADLEYTPGDVPALIAPIERGEADAVLGSRFIRQRPRFFVHGGMPFFSHYLGNQCIIWLTNRLYGFRATDYEGCYKAFRRQLVCSTPVVADGFEFDNELICKLLRRRARIVEVPIRYTPRVYREGKKIRWYHGVRILWTILKWRILPLTRSKGSTRA